jgi:hypothetical protein
MKILRQWLFAVLVPDYSGGPAPDFHGIPFEDLNLIKFNEKSNKSQ